MKIATIIVRILLGGLMIFASVAYFFKFGEQEAPTGDMLTIMTGFMATKYLFPLAKVIELIAGITILTGKYMKAGLLFLLPISVNIFLLHVVVTQTELPIAIFILAANLFLIYTQWDTYKGIFTA